MAVKFEEEGVKVGVGDVGTIIDLGNAGALPDDTDIFEQAVAIARRAIDEKSERAREMIGQGDPKFRAANLLKRLDTLDQADTDPIVSDELSIILHILDPGHGVALFPEDGKAVFSLESIPDLIKVYEKRKKDLEEALSRAEAKKKQFEDDEDVLGHGYAMARANFNNIEADLKDCEHDLLRLKDYLEPVDVPDDRKMIY